MQTGKLRAVFYARVSTEEEAQLKALPKQIEENRAEIRKKGWVLVGEYIDEGKSGTKIKGRDEYQRLLDDMEQDKFDVVVVKDQDRLQRNTKDWYIFVDRLVVNHLELFFYLENKFYTPDDALITGIRAIMAEEYSRNLSKKLHNYHDRRTEKARAGETVRMQGSGNIFGWDKKDGKYVVNAEQFKCRRRMCELILEGRGSTETAKILNDEGYRNTVGKEWKKTDISKFVYDEHNIGIVTVNKTRNDFDTKSVVNNPESEWVRIEGAMEPVVTMEEWEKLCEIREHRTTGKGRGRKVGHSIFSGKVKCGCCGKMFWKVSRKRGIEYWGCSAQKQYGKKLRVRDTASGKAGDVNPKGCDNKPLSTDFLMEIMKVASARLEANPEAIKADMIKWLEELRQTILGANTGYTEGDLKKEVARKDKLLDAFLDGTVSKEDYQGKAAAIEEKIRAIKADLKKEGSKAEAVADINRALADIDNEVAKYLGQEGKVNVDFVLENFSEIVVFEDEVLVRIPILNEGIIVSRNLKSGGKGGERGTVCSEGVTSRDTNSKSRIPLGNMKYGKRTIALCVELT